MIMCPEAFVSITMAMVYLPVFYKLQITSSYEVTIKINYAIIEKFKRRILAHMAFLQFQNFWCGNLGGDKMSLKYIADRLL